MGQSFGGFVAQSYATRHPEHPAALILSSTSPKKNMARNLAMFEKLGGASARSTAEEFYGDPSPEKLGDFIKQCMSLYNTRFSDPDGMKRSVLRGEVLFRQIFLPGQIYGQADHHADSGCAKAIVPA